MADADHNAIESHSDSGERWLPVPGYEGHYEVSDLGRVRSIARVISRVMADGSTQHQNRPEKFLGQTTLGGKWYPRVTLTVDHQKKTISVHTLVLRAFVGPAPSGMECRHLDGNLLNNRLTNLEWGTHLENEADKERHGNRYRGEMISRAALSSEDVREIRRAAAEGVLQKALARQFSVSCATINRAVHGKTWAHVQ